MRTKRYAYLLGIIALTLIGVEIVFQPIGQSPKLRDVSYEFTLPKPAKDLLAGAKDKKKDDTFEDLAQRVVDKQKLGDFLVSLRDRDNTLLVDGQARTRQEAQRKGKALQKALRKEWPGIVWDTDKFKEALKNLGDTPVAKLGPLALYPFKLHLKYGLDLQGGVHLVLQCRRALFEYVIPGWGEKTAEQRLADARKVRQLLRRRGITDMEVALPPDNKDVLQVRTQAASKAEFKRHQRIIDQVLKSHYKQVVARKPVYYELQRDTVDRTIEIVRRRVDKLGVSEPVIQRQGTDRLVVELAGVYDPKKAIDYIGTTARLEFRKIPERYEPKVDKSGPVEKVYFVDKRTKETVDAGVVFDQAPLILSGTDLRANATVGVDQFGNPTVDLEFNPVGKKKFAQFTRRNVHKYLGIFLDRECISAPVVKEPITGGRCQISGGFEDPTEAKRLKVLLNAGALPIPIDVVENRTVTATLGADSLHRSLVAGLWGVTVVFLFMLVYYRLPGLLAGLSLCVYGVLVFAILAMIKATLTLPGLAGFILSVGMAVDANVIIFERLKEELRTNKTFKSAVDAGFNRAWTAILDSQITTLIAAAVLFVYGTGPIQGFALTLIVGVVSNLFTAISVTRLFMNLVADTSLARKRFLYLS